MRIRHLWFIPVLVNADKNRTSKTVT